MPRLERLSEIQRKSLLTHPCLLNDTAPFTRLQRPLAAARLALVTTAAIHLRGDRPFTNADPGYRVFPMGTPAPDLIQSHVSIGFDRTAIQQDLNVVFPADRLRELVQQGAIGGLAPNAYAFLGAQRPPYDALQAAAGEVAQHLLGEGAEVVLLTGTWPLCTHTVGVLARVLEEAGLATTSISMVREHTEKVKPPRALFVPFPLGRPLGAPNAPALQTQVIRAALDLLDAPAGPVLADFPDAADPYVGQDVNLPQASTVSISPQAPADVAFEVTGLRPYYEQFVQAHDGRTTVGLSGIDQRRFRGAVRFLEAYAAGDEAADAPERPPDVSVAQFARWVADDLKAFYLEARTAQRPRDTYQDLNTWLWSETALANLLRTIATRMNASGDRALSALAFGIAR